MGRDDNNDGDYEQGDSQVLAAAEGILPFAIFPLVPLCPTTILIGSGFPIYPGTNPRQPPLAQTASPRQPLPSYPLIQGMANGTTPTK